MTDIITLTYCVREERKDGNAVVNTWKTMKHVCHGSYEMMHDLMRERHIDVWRNAGAQRFYNGDVQRLEIGSMRDPAGYLLAERTKA